MDLFIPAKLKENVSEWRKNDYNCDYPAISEILNYGFFESESGDKILRFLRKAQFEALETYWYLRLVEKTPHIFELYRKIYPKKSDLMKALGIAETEEIRSIIVDNGFDYLIEKIKNSDEKRESDKKFLKRNKLEVIKESLNLQYPSYILALAMGSGKTVLIGSIIATEFAMALEYNDGFVKNALVFAPGKTILGALKEISDIPFERILPPRFYKQFMSSVKITYTQDKEKNIPIIRKSSFNIIVTNTEKIRIQKPTGKTAQFNLLNIKEVEKFKEEQEIANLRLQTIASLPHLAIFSDEAHHTYGQSLDTELKKVRKTVDYLSENTNVIAVVNTTGTPYYKKQMLRDVVFWYGLSQGIKDGILKEVKDSIFSYDNVSAEDFVKIIIEDFFKNYKDVELFDGTKSKIAIYFPQTDDLRKTKPVVEKKVKEMGLDPSIVLEVHNESDEKIKDMFNNRINEPHNPYRVYLLVNMGTEGWNCPSLFATALARELKTSNNFVLQAASRCLRQIPNNTKKARIYLSKDNVNVLDSQLKETFGESLQILDMTKQEMRKAKLVLRKTEIPPILIKRKIKRIVVDENKQKEITIDKPDIDKKIAKKIIYDVKERENRKRVLTESGMETIELSEEFADIYEIAVELSAMYRLDLSKIYEMLNNAYADGEIPISHIMGLKEQIERQTKNYKITEEEIEVALALVRKEGFDKEEIDGKAVYTTEIIYHKDKENLLLKYEQFKGSNKKDFSFHYSPYKMDSNPEKDFFERLLEALNENPDDVEDIYFMGAITDPKKTDFLFEYLDKNGKYRNYTPDFVIKKKDGKTLIIEIKSERMRDDRTDGEIKYKNEEIDEERSGLKAMAIKKIENLNPNKLKYQILFTPSDEIGFENVQKIRDWVYGETK